MEELNAELQSILYKKHDVARKSECHKISTDIACDKSNEFVPVIKHDSCYVAGSILFDDKGRVLLIQEAKPSCRGEWYIAAGRVERNENFIAAAQRETLEEAGLTFEPLSLLTFEMRGLNWVRLLFTGKVTGGALKTTADGDEESLQAQWFPVKDVMNNRINLRSNDVKRVIELAQKQMQMTERERILPILPVSQSYKNIIVKLLLLNIDQNENVSIIVNVRNRLHLPIVELSRSDHAAHAVVHRLVTAAFGKNSGIHSDYLGLAGVEYNGGSVGDGMLLTRVYLISQENMATLDPYKWTRIDDADIRKEIIACVKHKRFVPSFVT